MINFSLKLLQLKKRASFTKYVEEKYTFWVFINNLIK